jgi:chromosome segregation ATPase
MVKAVLRFCGDVFFLVQETHQTKESVRRVEDKLERLSRIVEGLSYQVQHIKEVERLEREKLTLQLQSILSEFERRFTSFVKQRHIYFLAVVTATRTSYL